MSTPTTQRPQVPSPRYGPALSPLRRQQALPQPPPCDRPTSTDIYPCTDPSPRRRPRQQRTRSIQFAPPRHRPHNRLLGTPRALLEAKSLHLPVDGPTFLRQHTAFHTGHKALTSDSMNSTILLDLIPFKVYTCQRD